MKKASIKNIVWAIVPALVIGFTACKDKDDTTPTTTTTTTKTLNKTSLTNNKTWYDKGSFTVHKFKSGGVYGTNGSWNWVNNSDTMEIIYIQGDPKVKWKFNWNTDTEMEFEWIVNGPAELFKSTEW